MVKGRIVKGVAAQYTVLTDNGQAVGCSARGRLRANGALFIGDFVEISQKSGDYTIEKVLPRKNSLIRPYVSNIDVCLIVAAPIPVPDFTLIDKVLLNCKLSDIKAVIVINKSDLCDKGFIDCMAADYRGAADVLACSAKGGQGLNEVRRLFTDGQVVCLAGQSAVGKSSLINALTDDARNLQTGELSARAERGKHTTRQSEIIDTGRGLIIDTCGFSMLEFPDTLSPQSLTCMYYDFESLAKGCRYAGCSHISEPDCAVKEAVKNGVLSAERYERYKELYKEINERWKKRYD